MINWREVPFLRLLLPFGIGIFVGVQINQSTPLFIGLLLSLIAVLYYWSRRPIPYHRRWQFGLVLSISLFLFGYQLAYYHNDLNAETYFQHSFDDQERVIVGKVVNVPVEKKRIKVEVETIFTGISTDSLQKCTGKLLVYLDKNEGILPPEYGTILLLHARPFAIPFSKNPHAFDYRRYLFYNNIHYQAFIKSEKWDILDRDEGNILLTWAFNIQAYCLQVLKKHLNEREFAVGAALLLGYKGDITDELQAAYADTGAMHVLAVSGLHVGIVGGIVAWLILFFTQKMGIRKSRRRWISAIAVILTLWSFAFITGASPSVLRAASMFTFLTIGMQLNRFSNIYNNLAASAFLLLCVNPFSLWNVGFQLSYIAVLGIVYFQPLIYKRLSIQNKLGDYIWQLSSVSIAAQISTFPISLYYFHQFPSLFWLSGLLVIPMAGVILSTGIFFLLFHQIPYLGPILGKIVQGSLWFMNHFIFLIQEIPFGIWKGFWISLAGVLVMYCIISTAIVTIEKKRLAPFLIGLSLLLILVLNRAFILKNEHSQKQLCFYSIYKNTLVDCVAGQDIYSFKSRELETSKEQFATQNNRWYLGAKQVARISLDTNKVHFPMLYYEGNILQFYNKKIAFIEKLPPILRSPLSIDYVVLRNSPSFTLSDLRAFFPFKTLIIDTSNKTKFTKKWLQICQNNGLDCINLHQKSFSLAISN